MLARHVHLPVQSGSDRVLRRMIRRYTRAEYVARAARLMRARPGLTLSTDVIVGFPGETEDDFAQTLSLVREVGFVSLFGFKYSPRPHTPALRLADDVPEDVKSERLARLFAGGRRAGQREPREPGGDAAEGARRGGEQEREGRPLARPRAGPHRAERDRARRRRPAPVGWWARSSTWRSRARTATPSPARRRVPSPTPAPRVQAAASPRRLPLF